MGFVKKVALILIACLVVYVAVKLQEPVDAPGHLDPDWWVAGPRRKDDTTIKQFKVNVSESVLTDLKTRLQLTRFKADLNAEETGFRYGVQTSSLKEVVKYWVEKYDWRKQEAVLNSFPQFKTEIEGLNIHFLHVKPTSRSGVKVLPMLMVHGWPGSIWEFHKLIPLLTQPHEGIAVELVCPSLPGYGFSDPAQKPGMSPAQVARLFTILMDRLGHKKYYVQGGDWGAAIIHYIATIYPEKVLGLHTNAPSHSFSPWEYMKITLGAFIPSLIVSPKDERKLYPIKDHLMFILQETGYMHHQGTKPDTIAVGLTDSPAGLAAYILEKFSTWTDPKYRELPDGGIFARFTRDELLTNVMIYWINANIGSSMRIYREFFANMDDHQLNNAFKTTVQVPVGVAAFPNEFIPCPPKEFLVSTMPHLIQYTDMREGGHFPALEVPNALAEDIQAFIKTAEKWRKNNK